MTRSEHLKWAKERALAYLPSNPTGAIASIVSDLRKHPETEDHSGIQLTAMLMLGGHLKDVNEVRRHIEGFN